MAHIILALFAITLSFLCLKMLTLVQVTTGFSLKLIPRDSPKSPLYFGNISYSERLDRIVKLSKARAYILKSPQNMRLNVSHDDLYFVAKIRIGNPWVSVFLALDTGSSLTWTQCQPCLNCYHQVPPFYDSRVSRTYRQVPCNHPNCLSDPTTFTCINQKCFYQCFYTSGSVSRGILSQDTFEFMYNNRTSLIFGCGRDNRNMPFQDTGRIAGILGLNFFPGSLVQQLGHVINHRFSYCLVPFNRAPGATSFLRFGEDIDTRGRRFRSTPIVGPPGSRYYYLNLIDISINNHRIGIPPGSFEVKRDGSGGFIIDSGSPVTFLQQHAYEVVIPKFEYYFSVLGLRRYEGDYRGLNVCYHYMPRFHAYASMTFHFQGADLTVDPEFLYLFNQEEGIFCLPILPIDPTHPSMLGVYHQQNTRFIYDISNRILQFASENCLLDAN